MTRTAENIRSRLVDLCAKVFTFAFQLRAKERARGGGSETADSGLQPLGKQPGTDSIGSGLPDMRDPTQQLMDIPQDAFTTVAIQPFVSEAIQEAASQGQGQFSEGEDQGGDEGVNQDAWSEAESLQLKVDGYFRQLDSYSQAASEVTLMLRKDQIHQMREKSTGITAAHIQLAKYALVAFLDELVLMSKLPIREAWASKPLQLQYFDDFNAGESFYDKIEELRRGIDDPATLQVLEVYYTTLALGFRGKYNGRQGMEQRKILIEQLSREIAAARGEETDSLAPNWEPPDELPPPERKLSAWVLPLSIAGAVFGLFFVFKAVLGNMTSEITQLLDKAHPMEAGAEEGN